MKTIKIFNETGLTPDNEKNLLEYFIKRFSDNRLVFDFINIKNLIDEKAVIYKSYKFNSYYHYNKDLFKENLEKDKEHIIEVTVVTKDYEYIKEILIKDYYCVTAGFTFLINKNNVKNKEKFSKFEELFLKYIKQFDEDNISILNKMISSCIDEDKVLFDKLGIK